MSSCSFIVGHVEPFTINETWSFLLPVFQFQPQMRQAFVSMLTSPVHKFPSWYLKSIKNNINNYKTSFQILAKFSSLSSKSSNKLSLAEYDTHEMWVVHSQTCSFIPTMMFLTLLQIVKRYSIGA